MENILASRSLMIASKSSGCAFLDPRTSNSFWTNSLGQASMDLFSMYLGNDVIDRAASWTLRRCGLRIHRCGDHKRSYCPADSHAIILSLAVARLAKAGVIALQPRGKYFS